MRRRFPFSAIPLLLITITIIISSHPPPSLSAQVDNHHLICSEPFDCGNIAGVRYPFWGSTRPDYCGHPEFMLNCTSDTAEITIESLTYEVLEINGQSRNLKVARKDYIDNICPRVPATTSLNFTYYSYDRDLQNITLYYGCPPPNPSIPTGPETFTFTFDCDDNSGFFVTRNLENITQVLLAYFGTCKDKVIVPATQSAVKGLETGGLTVDKLIVTLEQGFGLEWHANDSLCNKCESSEGICGSNSNDGSFACYCTDRPYPESCGGAGLNQPESSGSKSRPVTVGVGVGIAGAAIVGIGLGCWILIWVQRRKRIAAQTTSKDLNTPSSKTQPATTISFSQTTASYPSSKSDLGKGSTYFGTQVFSYEELVEATDNFNPSKELGDGGFGTVYYGVLNDGRVVAVKRLFENNMKRAEQFMNEIEILTRLRHKNLVALYGCTSKRSRELLLVYEYIPNGTVADHLHGNRSKSGLLSWKVRLSIAIETADALAFLHASDVIHRDVKTNNILLDNNFHVKVADFGLSRLFPNDVSHVSTAPQGTPGYVDPEYYQCYQLTDKSDVYSFGVVIIELISSLQAVDTNRHRHDINLANMAINKIQNHALKELVDPMLGFEKDHVLRKMITSVAELAFRCLQVERDMRPTMAEVSESLKKIESEDYGSEQDLVLDIKKDEIVPLSNVAPLSPNESVASDKWVSSSSITTTTASF